MSLKHQVKRFTCSAPLDFRARHILDASKSLKNERRLLLEKVYEPALKLDKNSMAHYRLSLSGQCWLGFHNPRSLGPYLELQRKYQDLLAVIDTLRNVNSNLILQTSRALLPRWVQESSRLAGNPLSMDDAVAIDGSLEALVTCRNFYRKINIRQLRRAELPEAAKLLPGGPVDDIVELRNNLIAARWVFENAISHKAALGLDTHEIRDLFAAIVKNTRSEETLRLSSRIELGDYRRKPATMITDPLRIFPYPEEIPELMRGLVQWRDTSQRDELLHPLLLACHLCAYATHISPFPCGNGKISRILSLDLLIRHGYLPAMFGSIGLSEYSQMIAEAQDHNPSSLVKTVLDTQRQALEALNDDTALCSTAGANETATMA